MAKQEKTQAPECPSCGAEDYEDGYECNHCCYLQLTCPYCGQVVYSLKDGDAQFNCCACTGAWYSFSIEDFSWEDPEFESFCRKLLSQDKTREPEDSDELNGHDIVEVVKDLTWIDVTSFEGDGAGIIFFFVNPMARREMRD